MAAKRTPARTPVTAAAAPPDEVVDSISVPAELLSQMLSVMAGSGIIFNPDAVTSAGIPTHRRANTMLGVQKFRADYYRLDRKTVGAISRMVTERNWFAATTHATNHAIYGAGFRFAGTAENQWAADYPFRQMHNDLLHEFLVSDSVVALWRSDSPPGTLPYVEVPDMETVDYAVIEGVPQITVSLPSQPLRPLAERIGEKMADAMRKGTLTVRKGYAEEDGFDFAIMKRGKSNAAIPPPSMTGILDDLDFIECVRVGDWNGAYARREILRVTKKGSGISSGQNAGSARNNARYKDIKAITEAMRKVMGKADLATNWDQSTEWLTFSDSFFKPEIVEPALRRLIFWGGLGAISMLKTDSQMAGMSALLYDTIRARVLKFREDFAVLLRSIYTAETFSGGSAMPELEPQWSVKPLYSTDAFIRLTSAMSERAIIPPQMIREQWFGVDDAEMSELMRQAHAKREDYTPAYEPRQGLLQGLFPQDYVHPAKGGAGGEDNHPGRPAAID